MNNIIDYTVEEGAVAPMYAHVGDAGADIHANEHVVIAPGARALVKSGIKIALPEGTVGMVCSRSGHANKHGVFVLNAPGIVDSKYRGDVGVILQNLGNEDFVVNPGDRIAQLVVVPFIHTYFNEVDSLDETERGGAGFGSTGKN